MRYLKMGYVPIIIMTLIMAAGCASWNKTQKGAVIGTASGGAIGAVVGKASGNTALGAIIGAAVGGTAGALIGNKMDKQAAEIANKVPDAKVIRIGEGIAVEFSSKVLFGFDKSDLTAESRTSLNKLVKVLDEYPDTNIEIQGHTDSKGTASYNQTLSVQRAAAVSNYLAAQNLSRNRLTVKGFGESLPKYINDTEDGRDQNRRVEFLITANDKMKAEAKREASGN